MDARVLAPCVCDCGALVAEHTPDELAGCRRAFGELRALREESDAAPPEKVLTLPLTKASANGLRLLALDTALALAPEPSR